MPNAQRNTTKEITALEIKGHLRAVETSMGECLFDADAGGWVIRGKTNAGYSYAITFNDDKALARVLVYLTKRHFNQITSPIKDDAKAAEARIAKEVATFATGGMSDTKTGDPTIQRAKKIAGQDVDQIAKDAGVKLTKEARQGAINKLLNDPERGPKIMERARKAIEIENQNRAERLADLKKLLDI